jgi:hypothetical protein
MASVVRWHLELGSEVVAQIADAKNYDFLWTYGVLVESLKFECLRSYFIEEDRPDDDPAIEALCNEVQSRGGFTAARLPDRAGAFQLSAQPTWGLCVVPHRVTVSWSLATIRIYTCTRIIPLPG